MPTIRASGLWGALLVLSIAGGCAPTPEKACAAAAAVTPAFDQSACLGDLRREQEEDPVIYEQDVRCLARLASESGGSLPGCLANPRSMQQVQQQLTRARRALAGHGADVDEKMARLREAVTRVRDDRQRAAFGSLLDEANQQQAAVKGQLARVHEPGDGGDAKSDGSACRCAADDPTCSCP